MSSNDLGRNSSTASADMSGMTEKSVKVTGVSRIVGVAEGSTVAGCLALRAGPRVRVRLGGSGFAGDPSAAARFLLAAGAMKDGILNVMKTGNGLQGNQGKRWCWG